MLTCSVCGEPAVIAPLPAFNVTMGAGSYQAGVLYVLDVDVPYCAAHNPIQLRWPVHAPRAVVPAGYFDTSKLLTELKAQREENERLSLGANALRDIVRIVAEADNSDHSVCYQLCSYDIAWTDDADDEHQVMTHNGPCVVEQARAALASADETQDEVSQS